MSKHGEYPLRLQARLERSAEDAAWETRVESMVHHLMLRQERLRGTNVVELEGRRLRGDSLLLAQIACIDEFSVKA